METTRYCGRPLSLARRRILGYKQHCWSSVLACGRALISVAGRVVGRVRLMPLGGDGFGQFEQLGNIRRISLPSAIFRLNCRKPGVDGRLPYLLVGRCPSVTRLQLAGYILVRKSFGMLGGLSSIVRPLLQKRNRASQVPFDDSGGLKLQKSA